MVRKQFDRSIIFGVSILAVTGMLVAGCGGGGGSSLPAPSNVSGSVPGTISTSSSVAAAATSHPIATGTGSRLSATATPSSAPTATPSSAPTAITLTGQVVNVWPNPLRFELKKDTDGDLVVFYSESVVNPANAVIALNQNVSATGIFHTPAPGRKYGEMINTTKVVVNLSSSPSPSPTPTGTRPPSPTPVPSGPYHIATWAYDDRYGEGSGVSAATINQLVTYAQGDGKALSDCPNGSSVCQSVFYLRPYALVNPSSSTCKEHPDTDILAIAPENWFVHDTGYSDSTHRVWGTDLQGCVMYSMNPNNTAMQAWWASYLQANANTYDLFFIDEEPMDLVDSQSFHSGGGCIPYPSYCHSTQEIATDAAMVAAHVGFVNQMNYVNGSQMHFMYQQAYPSRTLSLDLSALASTSRFLGVTCEGCITNTASTVVPSNYGPYLNEMAALIAANGKFLMLSDGDATPGSATEILQRLVTTGMMWLAYSEGHTIVQPNLERYTKNLAIWPEDLIYPSGPVQSMVSGAVDLQVAPGVWRREFTTCYQKSKFFGRCAAIVNSNASAMSVQSSWLTKTYNHTVSLVGGDVLSGGTATVGATTFTANVTTVPAKGAILITQ